ncbi:MAG: hypothetical protein GY786_01310 [Proteobacteria bacterium]|nr:hypothetical protein [Pseudomonadota bacterium]
MLKKIYLLTGKETYLDQLISISKKGRDQKSYEEYLKFALSYQISSSLVMNLLELYSNQKRYCLAKKTLQTLAFATLRLKQRKWILENLAPLMEENTRNNLIKEILKSEPKYQVPDQLVRHRIQCIGNT